MRNSTTEPNEREVNEETQRQKPKRKGSKWETQWQNKQKGSKWETNEKNEK